MARGMKVVPPTTHSTDLPAGRMRLLIRTVTPLAAVFILESDDEPGCTWQISSSLPFPRHYHDGHGSW